MKVEIWSDFVCPFCYIGKRHLEKALDIFPHKSKITIEYKSYELSPNAELDSHMTASETLAVQYGMSIEKAQAINEHIRALAAEVGIIYHVDCIKPTNTFDAHRLAKYASSQGKEELMIESLLKAYFTEARHIGDHETLTELAEEVGLNREAVQHVLNTDVFGDAVHDDELLARQIGVQGVPFFVFNEEYALSGAQPIDIFVQVLEGVWEEYELRRNRRHKSKTSYCTDEGCYFEDE